MNKLYKITPSAMLGLILSNPMIAQGTVDVALYQNNGQLEVRVRPDAEFNGVFSSIVFTIKWDRSTGAALGTVQQEGAPEQYIPVM